MSCKIAKTGIYAEEFVTPPPREPDGQVSCEQTWINKATSWIGGMNALCVDAKNRRCRIGAHFMRATEENTYPIRFWYGEGGETKAEQKRSKARSKAVLKANYPWRY